MRLDSSDVFSVVKNAQKAGLLKLLAMKGHIGPGERFFESVQRSLLEKLDLEKLDVVLYHLAPTLCYMTDEEHWEPAEFTSDDMFKAVRNLQRMGAFDVIKANLQLPGSGDRFFESAQAILVEKLGVETLDNILYTLGQCIKFLATDAAMVNMKSSIEGRTCA